MTDSIFVPPYKEKATPKNIEFSVLPVMIHILYCNSYLEVKSFIAEYSLLAAYVKTVTGPVRDPVTILLYQKSCGTVPVLLNKTHYLIISRLWLIAA